MAGDCLVYTFAEISVLKARDPDLYRPMPAGTELTTCNIKPAAACARRSDYQFVLKLNDGVASSTEVTGTVGPFLNPFSQGDVQLSSISIYKNCDVGAPDLGSVYDAVTVRPSATIQPATTTAAAVSGVQATVGADAEDNIATFTFSPATVLSTHGGEIVITAPDWYTATSPPLQAYRSTVQNMCSSDFLTISTQTAA